MIRAILIALLIMIFPALAHEHGRTDAAWEALTQEERDWYKSLTRPDMAPGLSCCGEADQYWCDGLKVDGEAVFCQITDDRPDEMFMSSARIKREHVPVGTWIRIPPEKMKFGPNDPQQPASNPTGHSIVFLGSNHIVFCFVLSTGI